MAARERHLLTRLSTMEAKLRLMKEETAEYKKRLTIQKHKLFLDSLTQVHNRAALDERLELEYKRWLRYNTPLCLAIIDIDHFKHINDNYGHMAGDKALKVVAKALQGALRDTDFIARFGGEEFVVLLPNINPDKFQKPLETLRQTIKSIPFRFRDARVEITISIGATLFREGITPRTRSSGPTRRSTVPRTRVGIRSIWPEWRLKKQQTHFPLFPCPTAYIYYQIQGMPQVIPFSPREKHNDNKRVKGEPMITHINPVGSMDLLSQLEVDRPSKPPPAISINCFATARWRYSTPAAIPTAPKRY